MSLRNSEKTGKSNDLTADEGVRVPGGMVSFHGKTTSQKEAA